MTIRETVIRLTNDLSQGDGVIHLYDRLRFNTKKRLDLYRMIAAFMRNGESLNNIITSLLDSYEVHYKNDVRIKLLTHVARMLREGKSFSYALSDWVPSDEVILIRAGEATSRPNAVVEAIENVIEAVDAKKKLISSVVASLAYPVFVFIILLFLVHMSATEIFPRFREYSDPNSWSSKSLTLFNVADFINTYDLLLLIAVVAIISLIIYSLPVYTGNYRQHIDRLPPWNIYKAMQSSAFLISTSALLKGGTPILNALETISHGSSAYLRYYLDIMQNRIRDGQGGDALSTGLFDKEMTVKIEVYSRTSELADMIEKLGRESIEATIASIKIKSALLGTIMMLLAGFVIYLMFTTIMEINAGSSYT